jgi:6-methylsalicylate decarboxylase
MPRHDLHQHLWPEPLIAALARRRSLPRMRSDATGRWRVELTGEPAGEVDLRAHDPVRRAALAERDGVDVVAVCLSSPLGIEALPPAEAAPLLAAYNAGILELGGPFVLWGAVSLARPAPAAVDALLDAGAIGISLPAAGLADADALARVRPLLARLAERGAPLLVHPGPAPWTIPDEHPDAPAWWAPLTSYVAEMHQAWHAFAAWGRSAHPRLRVVWTMLAGGAPLHGERLVARGGPAAAPHDPLAYYDVSSTGPRTLDIAIRALGVDRLVHGSDRPVVEPVDPGALGDAVAHALLEHNPQLALGRAEVAA